MERKEMRATCNDEFGPIFSRCARMRAPWCGFRRCPNPTRKALRKHGRHPGAVNALQHSSKDSGKIAPVGLAELGCAKRLGPAAALRESIPKSRRDDRFSRALGKPEKPPIEIYRIVQEALTNVFRHAGATSVNSPSNRPNSRRNAWKPRLRAVRIRDNGRACCRIISLARIDRHARRILALGGTSPSRPG